VLRTPAPLIGALGCRRKVDGLGLSEHECAEPDIPSKAWWFYLMCFALCFMGACSISAPHVASEPWRSRTYGSWPLMREAACSGTTQLNGQAAEAGAAIAASDQKKALAGPETEAAAAALNQR